MSELTKRTLSIIAFAPLILAIIVIGNWVFNALILAVAVIAAQEWRGMTKGAKKSEKIKWAIIGILYIGIPCLSLVKLNSSSWNTGPILILWMVFVVWATDIGAYIFGRLIGGPKLLPKISPKKTWAGLIGGMICAGLVSMVAVSNTELSDNPILFVFIGAFLAVVAQAGDFFESWVKRKFNVKDSGNLIPGHGGILDRVDGLFFVAPLVAIGGSIF